MFLKDSMVRLEIFEKLYISNSGFWKSFICSPTLEKILFVTSDVQILSLRCLVLTLLVELSVLHRLQQLA